MNNSRQIVSLPAGLSSDFVWDLPKAQENLVWHLDFGWDQKPLSIYDEAHFNTYRLSIEELCKKISLPAKLILAYSDGIFSQLLAPSETLETRYEEYLVEEGIAPTSFQYELFCATLFSEYLHRLASSLPEEVEAFLVFAIAPEQNFAKNILLLSRRRFEHFQLYFSKESIPVLPCNAKIGISLPREKQWDEALFAPIFSMLKAKNIPFQCIPEELLNEHWEGIDYLLVDPKAVSSIGKRMLCGFSATGGTVVTLGEPLSFIDTITVENLKKEIGVEGFEPPTHCSQSSCASQTALYSDIYQRR